MDEQIIQSVLDGDIEEFRHLIRKYQQPSFNLARSIIKSDLIAEEAVQDAFVRAFQHLHKFRKKASFSTWLYRIVLNESLKKVKNVKLDSIRREEDFGEQTIEPEALERLYIEEQKELINLVLDRLRSNESLVLKLFYLEEKRMEEIREISGLSIANIKVLLHRARNHFGILYTELISVKH